MDFVVSIVSNRVFPNCKTQNINHNTQNINHKIENLPRNREIKVSTLERE